MKRKIFFAVFFASACFFFLNNASALEPDTKALILKGKNELETGKYAEAIKSLENTGDKACVIGDYILLWLANAYSESGDIEKSNSKLRELLKNYPESILRKKARNLEVKNIIPAIEAADATFPEQKDFCIIEAYVRDYPDDRELKFLFGQILKKKGENNKARSLFKNLYIRNNGVFSKMAFNELSDSDITSEDMIERASNLMDAMEFQTAESLLRDALTKDDGRHKDEILKKLGRSVFKQKRYKESAEIYEKAGNYYWRAIALYRAGEKEAFDAIVKKMTSMEDKRVGALLMLSASSKRRNGEINEAVNIYKNIKVNYPARAEDSLWGIGWTYYRSGDSQKAADAFAELSKIYERPKYFYWKARSMDETGEDASHIYRKLANGEQDFYSVLARMKRPRIPELNAQKAAASEKEETEMPKSSVQETRKPKLKSFGSERIDILMELGMNKEAASELAAASKKAVKADDIVPISLRLQEAGEYKMALNLASRLQNNQRSDSEIIKGVLYPLAHWPVVREASARYGIDPFIVLSVMREESRFDAEARSEAGALGLMQLMPHTAYRIDKGINLNVTSMEHIYDIRVNIMLGSYYISSLITEFGSLPAAIAAYNAGEDIVRKWQRSGNYKSVDEFIEDIPYDETKNFVKRVLTTYFEYHRSSEEKDIPKIQ